MNSQASRNLAAFRAMQRVHTITLGGARLEIDPPGMIQIAERITAELGVDVATLIGGGADMMAILHKFPSLARWLGVETLGGKTASPEDRAEIEAYVDSLRPLELLDLAKGIVEVLMPEAEMDGAKKKVQDLAGALHLANA